MLCSLDHHCASDWKGAIAKNTGEDFLGCSTADIKIIDVDITGDVKEEILITRRVV